MAKFGFTHQIAEGTRSQGPQIDLPYVPENIIQLDAGYQFSFGTRIMAGYTFKDDSIEYDDYGDKVDIPSFSLISCGVYQTLWEDLTVSLIVQNLTDKNYYTESGFEQPGRTFKVSLRYVL